MSSSWIAERADRAWYLVNARNAASIDLHRAWGFREVARAARFHTIDFTGGVGILLRTELPARLWCDGRRMRGLRGVGP